MGLSSHWLSATAIPTPQSPLPICKSKATKNGRHKNERETEGGETWKRHVRASCRNVSQRKGFNSLPRVCPTDLAPDTHFGIRVRQTQNWCCFLNQFREFPTLGLCWGQRAGGAPTLFACTPAPPAPLRHLHFFFEHHSRRVLHSCILCWRPLFDTLCFAPPLFCPCCPLFLCVPRQPPSASDPTSCEGRSATQ